MGSILGPYRITAKDNNIRFIIGVGRMSWPKTDATHYYVQLELPDKGRSIKMLVICNCWELKPLDLLNDLALGCYRPSPEV